MTEGPGPGTGTSSPEVTTRGRGRMLAAAGMVALGIVLIALAVLRAVGSFTQDVDAGSGRQVTIECGNAFEARDRDDRVVFSDPEGHERIENVGAFFYDAVDACHDAGTSRLLTSGIIGAAGVVALIGAGVFLARTRSAAGARRIASGAGNT